jgi:hypothetical protein
MQASHLLFIWLHVGPVTISDGMSHPKMNAKFTRDSRKQINTPIYATGDTAHAKSRASRASDGLRLYRTCAMHIFSQEGSALPC